MFSLELPYRGDSNEYTQYTIFNQPKLFKICSYGIFFQGTQEPGLPLIIHFKIPRFFPEILQFSIPSDRSKKKIIFILYFNGVNCITSDLGVTLKGKNLLPKGANSFL